MGTLALCSTLSREVESMCNVQTAVSKLTDSKGSLERWEWGKYRLSGCEMSLEATHPRDGQGGVSTSLSWTLLSQIHLESVLGSPFWLVSAGLKRIPPYLTSMFLGTFFPAVNFSQLIHDGLRKMLSGSLRCGPEPCCR